MSETEASSLLQILRRRARVTPDRLAFTYLEDGESKESSLTWGELEERCLAIAAALQAKGATGNPVLLLYPPGLDFVAAFCASIYAGAIAVPAYPPDPARIDRTLPRVKAIISDASAGAVLTTSPIRQMAAFMFPDDELLSGLDWLASDELATGDSSNWKEPDLSGDSVAFLQYTSGSTGSPKGVVIDHANLLFNQEQMRERSGSDEETVILSWVPFYHDLGLIGGVVHPVYVGARSVLMSPMDFLQKPSRWLRAIDRYRATFSAGPNFGFELCTRRVSEEDRAGLDLASWRMALVGAEPISAQTLSRFAETFAPCGFDERAFFQGYGMAETVLSISSGHIGRLHNTLVVKRKELGERRVAPVERITDMNVATIELTSCGEPLPGQDVRIVGSDEHREVDAGEIGEIWVRGGNVARGYWQRAQDTEEVFRARLSSGEGPFLRTGDLGFMHDGELYVTGRVKDLIILRGRNVYPQDVEATVERAHQVLRPGCGAAFAVAKDESEELVVVQEVRRSELEGTDAYDVIGAIRRTLLREDALRPHAVVLIEARTIPKTSSGKIQRHATRQAFLAGSLEVIAQDVSEPEEDGGLLGLEELSAYPAGEREAVLEESLKRSLASALEVDLSEVATDAPLADTGLDSVAIMNLSHEVENQLGVELDVDLLLEGGSLESIARYVLDEAGLAVATSFPAGTPEPSDG